MNQSKLPSLIGAGIVLRTQPEGHRRQPDPEWCSEIGQERPRDPRIEHAGRDEDTRKQHRAGDRDNSPLVANLINVCLQKLLIDRDPKVNNFFFEKR